ncbi:Uncharacterised protein [Vibrio cholerae]|uniref:Uncharacterized protein n=1 Tax=Vibrio cholerae TaxID=666 RepID=A0A655Y0R9_VIBCL|nr:Uncharacterised protein [Vibrio cholerae]
MTSLTDDSMVNGISNRLICAENWLSTLATISMKEKESNSSKNLLVSIDEIPSILVCNRSIRIFSMACFICLTR